MKSYRIKVASVVGLLLSACSSDSSDTNATGTVQIIVVPEDSIPEGLTPGDGGENIKDGFTVTYDRYLIAIGDFAASRTQSSGDKISDPTTHVLDLKNAPRDGYIVTTWTGLRAAEWDKFGFSLVNANSTATGLAPTSDSDVAFMTSSGYSIYFEGKIDNGTDELAFKWGFAAGTRFADCADDQGKAGFAVPSGGSVQIKPTIHGDHWFFTNVTEGAEITERRAQWMVECNADKDGELTIAELKACKASNVFPSGTYNLAGITDQDGDGSLTAFDYVETQVRTLGDYQGDGECPTRTKL